MIFDFDPNDHRCRYLRINGARCRQAALDGETLCFEHKLRKLRTRPGRKPVCLPSSTFNEVPLVSFCWVEDHASILSNLNHIIEAFAHGVIDHRQAVAYGCLMRTCLKTLKQMHELEDLAVKEKEKPAQRFELDECELPLAIDEPARPAVPSDPCALSPEPSALSSDPQPAAPPIAADDTTSLEPSSSALSADRSTLPSDAGVSPICPVLADRESQDSPAAPDPNTAQPSTLASDPQPATPPSAADDNANPEPSSSTPSAECSALPSGPQPYNDPLFRRLNPHWEDCVRDLYHNNPAILATLGVEPRPDPAVPDSTTANPIPETSNATPEPCTLTLTAAADSVSSALAAEGCTLPPLPAPASQLPAFLSRNPYPVTPDPQHTYTQCEIFCEAQ